MQSFAVARRILPAFGKNLNALRPSSEIDVDLTVLAVVLPLHAHASRARQLAAADSEGGGI